MSGPRLPQELQDDVVGYLPHSDLHVASLVSKSWCRQGRKTLFREVRVLAPFTGSAFERFMNENPLYAGVVERLALCGVDGPKQLGCGHDEDEDEEDEEDGDDLDYHEQEPQLALSISLADISAILSLFPNLKKLELKDLSLVPSSIPLQIHLKAPTSLDELVLDHIVVAESVGAEDCLLNMWLLFSSIRNVKLVDIPNRLVSISHDPDCTVEGGITLQATSCVIRNVRSCNVFLELLRRGCSVSRPLTHLEVHTYTTADFRSLGNLLQIAGGRLECLHLDISSSIRNVDPDYMEPYISTLKVFCSILPY
ncbi:hypothetical protein PHLGIDRAFT_453713 [Phlebiopsis gigantea 11061_1 CR5-6]|uniref:F-box domain-containing protein n=1 Tax=Phlebiopsis gigantea (strain 11061_1 CR5-6) TaxID=745531 RepID=A0A0C3S720_PHLG1|nr:hypothetical protein PHLGIDRAFT_453713 [Phlebiopsis gigantea 11061_1 CR5-6]